MDYNISFKEHCVSKNIVYREGYGQYCFYSSKFVSFCMYCCSVRGCQLQHITGETVLLGALSIAAGESFRTTVLHVAATLSMICRTTAVYSATNGTTAVSNAAHAGPITADEVPYFLFEKGRVLWGVELEHGMGGVALQAVPVASGAAGISLRTAVILVRTAHSVLFRTTPVLSVPNRTARVLVRTRSLVGTGFRSFLLLDTSNQFHQRVIRGSFLLAFSIATRISLRAAVLHVSTAHSVRLRTTPVRGITHFAACLTSGTCVLTIWADRITYWRLNHYYLQRV